MITSVLGNNGYIYTLGFFLDHFDSIMWAKALTCTTAVTKSLFGNILDIHGY
jgi:hypothetical protein